MSIQQLLESSPIGRWLHVHPPLAGAGQMPVEIIAFEADRGEHPSSPASNITSGFFLSAEESQCKEILIRKVRNADEIYLDKMFSGSLPLQTGEAVKRRLLFLSGYLDYPPKAKPHHVHVRIHGRLQVWECRKRAESLELRLLS